MSTDGPASPLDPASRGWHLVPRGFWASSVYVGLRTPEARLVAVLVLFARPRFQDETVFFGGKPFVVKRGQLFDAEETLAERAGTSRKVVRTVIRTLCTAGLITRERVHPSGQCPHVITVRDYDLSQRIPEARGQRTGQSGASEGPEKGPKVTEGEPTENLRNLTNRARARASGPAPASKPEAFPMSGPVSLLEVEP